MEEPVTREQIENASLESKIKAAKEVVKRTLLEKDIEKTVIGFTGGKDSTAAAWFVKKVCEEENLEKPDFMFIDHGQHFNEIEQYVKTLANDWGFELHTIRNEDIIDQAEEPGDTIEIEKLNEVNKKEAKRVNDDIQQVTWLMDTEVGNHLLKTVPMNQFIKDKDILAVINGVRWDEHESRGNEDFYSPRYDPDHTRIHPILQFTEKDIWELTWLHIVPDITGYGFEEIPKTPDQLPDQLSIEELPISPKYWEGFRSLGSEVSTEKSAEKPAWSQDLENTKEREGRAQNKDQKEIMNKLREMGYM